MEERQGRARQWYVVQVATGNEDYMCQAIKRACADFDKGAMSEANRVGLHECFSPRFASRKKRKGAWYDTTRALIPGYVIADAHNPEKLAGALRGIEAFGRVLSSGGVYAPLDDAERRWIQAQIGDGGRTIPLSFGSKVGDKLVITSGPLKGHESKIVSVDRKNCIAHVEFHAGQITFKTSVGLAVMPGRS